MGINIRCDYIQLPNKALKSSRLRVDAERHSVSFLLFQNELMNYFCTQEKNTKQHSINTLASVKCNVNWKERELPLLRVHFREDRRAPASLTLTAQLQLQAAGQLWRSHLTAPNSHTVTSPSPRATLQQKDEEQGTRDGHF